MSATEINAELLAAQDRFAQAERELDEATQHRALVFALAQEHGRSSGDIARLVGPGVHTVQVQHILRVGRRLLATRRNMRRQSA